MTAKTKHTLKLLFGNLVNNNIAIEGAKTLPWWVATLMFVIGSFLPVIPIMVNASKTKGQDFVSSYTYSYDQGLVTCGVELKNEDLYKFEVKESIPFDYKKVIEFALLKAPINAHEVNPIYIKKIDVEK